MGIPNHAGGGGGGVSQIMREGEGAGGGRNIDASCTLLAISLVYTYSTLK